MKINLRTITLVVVLIMCVLLVVWFMYRSKQGDGADFSETNNNSLEVQRQRLPSKEVFEGTLNNDVRFRELKDFSEGNSYSTEDYGRKNPFAPVF